MFKWKAGTIRGESKVVMGARITPNNDWMAKFMLSGSPERIKVRNNHYLCNTGTKKNPVLVVIRQGDFVRAKSKGKKAKKKDKDG